MPAMHWTSCIYIAIIYNKAGMNRRNFCINIKINKAARTLTASDNVIGMTQDEMEKNLDLENPAEYTDLFCELI